MINYLLIAVALSMDAFSVATTLEMNNLLNIKKKLYLVSIIGLLHFIMPYLGNISINLINIKIESFANFILAFIFLILGIEVLTEKEKVNDKVNYFYLLVIAITVSIDSFTIGIGLSIINDYSILASIIFSIFSMFFTILGYIIGTYLNKSLKDNSSKMGGIILLLLCIKYLFKL